MINGTLTRDPYLTSNAFNSYIVGIGPLLASEIKSDINTLDYLTRTVDSICIREITVLEVQNTIREMKHSSPLTNIQIKYGFVCKTFAHLSDMTYIIVKFVEMEMYKTARS